MTNETFDLVVIGAGPAGEKGAITAGVFRKKVALVEKSPLLGGAVANTGTLPSKTLRETALAFSALRTRDLYGVDLSLRREATVTDFMSHSRNVSETERERVKQYFERFNVSLYQGTASFVDPHTLRVVSPSGETRLHAEKILIATGSAPLRPPEFPFEDSRVCDSDEILEIERLPRTMVVVGAGVIGSEYACTFAALGTRVHVVDGRDQLLSFLDTEVSTALEKAMGNLGIVFRWKERVTACDAGAKGGPVELTLTSGATLETDTVLVAGGRVSNTGELNLPVADVETGKRGLIIVDEQYSTTARHIYAVGDVIGFPALAATGMEQARVAVSHAFEMNFKLAGPSILPYGIYTIPEVSMVGETEESLARKGVDYIVGRASYEENARGTIIGDRIGFLKLLFRRGDLKLLGVHAIGEDASELVHVGLIAILTESDWDLFNRACFNFPTLGMLYQRAAYEALAKQRGFI
jgi:NAD(P) transhydrogenase